MQLFFDDARECPEGMTQCKTIEDAIHCFNSERVQLISFNFDLMSGESGYDLALWIENAVRKHVIPFPNWCIHSAEQRGRELITHVMNAASRYWYFNNPPSGSEVQRYGDEWHGVRALLTVGNFESEEQKYDCIRDMKTFLANSGWKYGGNLAGILIGSNPNDLLAHIYESHIYAAPLSEIEYYLSTQEELGFSTKCSLLLTLGACIAIGRAEDLLIWKNMKQRRGISNEFVDIPDFLRSVDEE